MKLCLNMWIKTRVSFSTNTKTQCINGFRRAVELQVTSAAWHAAGWSGYRLLWWSYPSDWQQSRTTRRGLSVWSCGSSGSCSWRQPGHIHKTSAHTSHRHLQSFHYTSFPQNIKPQQVVSLAKNKNTICDYSKAPTAHCVHIQQCWSHLTLQTWILPQLLFAAEHVRLSGRRGSWSLQGAALW